MSIAPAIGASSAGAEAISAKVETAAGLRL